MKHLFTIADDVWDSLTYETVHETAIALWKMDLFRPPYDEFDVNLVITGKFTQRFTNAKEAYVGRPFNITFRYKYKTAKSAYSVEFKLKDVFVPLDAVEDITDEPREQETSRPLTDASRFVLCALYVLLATKNAEKTIEKLKKHGPKSRKRPREYDYITTIKIGKITETQRGDGDGQSSVRPHLRRGHIRNQRVGKGLSDVKPIFIQPCFINADDSWINNQRKEYRVAA